MLIYSLKDMCPLSQPQKHFSCPAVITCFLLTPPTQQSLGRVFAGMSDGLVAVYSLLNDQPLEGETYLCSHSINKTLGVPESDRRQKAYPVNAMVQLGSDKELWYSNGPGVLVIDLLRLQPVRRLEAYAPPSAVVSMAASFCLWGQEAVWLLDDFTNTVLLFHAASYQLCAKYCCGDSNPLRDVFPVQHPTFPVSTAPEESGTPTAEMEQPTEFVYMCSQHAGAQIIQTQDSVTSELSKSSSQTSLEDRSSAPSTQPSLKGSSSAPSSQPSLVRSSSAPSTQPSLEGSVRESENQSPVEEEPSASAELKLKAITILCVGEALWIPRCGGDVLVLELQSGPQEPGHENENHQGPQQLSGRVTAVLCPPEGDTLGSLEKASLLHQDSVVCAYRDSASQWTVCVWRAWGGEQLQLFYTGWERLTQQESRLRRTRER